MFLHLDEFQWLASCFGGVSGTDAAQHSLLCQRYLNFGMFSKMPPGASGICPARKGQGQGQRAFSAWDTR
jgi:hypothetical protein